MPIKYSFLISYKHLNLYKSWQHIHILISSITLQNIRPYKIIYNIQHTINNKQIASGPVIIKLYVAINEKTDIFGIFNSI